MSILESPEYKAASWWEKLLVNIFGVLGVFRGHVLPRPSGPRPKPIPSPPRSGEQREMSPAPTNTALPGGVGEVRRRLIEEGADPEELVMPDFPVAVTDPLAEGAPR